LKRRPLLLPVLTRDKLPQGEDAQGDAPQAEPPDDPRLGSQGQWGERQRTAWQAPHALLDQGCASRGGDAGREAPRRPGVIGRVDAPAQAPHGLVQRDVIHARLDAHPRGADGLRRALPVAALGRFLPCGAHGEAPDGGDGMVGDSRGGGLTRFGLGGESLRPLLPFVERLDRIRGARGTLAQALFLQPGVGQGTDDHAPCLPSPRLARLRLTALCPGGGKADRVRLLIVHFGYKPSRTDRSRFLRHGTV